ncbi:MAG: hypothetical protein HDS84_07210 [Bacteroidales bacterium]|nr:hypothetical protein [Bacteroidales bacterium]
MSCLIVSASNEAVFSQTWHATSLHLSGKGTSRRSSGNGRSLHLSGNGTSRHSSVMGRYGARLSQFPNLFKKFLKISIIDFQELLKTKNISTAV